MQRQRRTDGFTLLELMIVVMLLGILALLAIPNFMTYQARARRSEAFANLSGLVQHQKSYFTEKGFFFETDNAYPDFTMYGGLDATQMPWDADAQTNYATLGWAPEGRVYYSYDLNAGGIKPCSEPCTQCFTGSAYGDVDADGMGSAVMYVQPEIKDDGTVLECPSGLFGFGTPVDPRSFVKVYNQVASNRQTDDL